MEAIVPIFFVVLFVAVAIGLVTWHYSRAESILEHWAHDHGFIILSKEHRWFRRGPFLFWTSEGQEVYYVTLRTKDCRVRRGWVRCGGWFLGVLSDQAEVRWDE